MGIVHTQPVLLGYDMLALQYVVQIVHEAQQESRVSFGVMVFIVQTIETSLLKRGQPKAIALAKVHSLGPLSIVSHNAKAICVTIRSLAEAHHAVGSFVCAHTCDPFNVLV